MSWMILLSDGLNLEIYYQKLEPCKVGIDAHSGSNDTVCVCKAKPRESCKHQESNEGLLVAIVPIEAAYLTGGL